METSNHTGMHCADQISEFAIPNSSFTNTTWELGRDTPLGTPEETGLKSIDIKAGVVGELLGATEHLDRD